MQKIVYAKHKYNSRSPQKVRLVVDLVRGKNAINALDILKFTNKGASEDVYKVLASAIKNATFNDGMDRSALVVADAFVNEAPTHKRGRAVSRGRYHKILKRNCHIIIGVAEEKVVTDTKKEVETKGPSKKEAKKSSPKVDKKKETAKSSSKSKSK